MAPSAALALTFATTLARLVFLLFRSSRLIFLTARRLFLNLTRTLSRSLAATWTVADFSLRRLVFGPAAAAPLPRLIGEMIRR